ncbi:hypothetical protein GOBAR_AA29968 [Gossypium barbadense]|uniref:Uncharacterized protein n=1 Tax=Gossypium barbadense TaxID=3634 RepID=A0A2P5WI13_GOSBA|nr:hypothetical protein GOBAR_AA29968 [Gossypium barbadense]
MTLQKLSFKEVHEPCSSNDRGHTHEERRLRIEELDEWQAHKPTTHDKLKLIQNEPDTSPNQLKVGDKVLQDAADPHIVTTTPNEEIPLTVLSIFPFGTVEVSHPKFVSFKVNNTRLNLILSCLITGTRNTNSLNYPDHSLESFSAYTTRHMGVPKAVAKQGNGRVEAGHDFPKTRDTINPHGRATWP